MAIITPTLEGITNSFIENIRNTIPELSTTPISVTREAFINPASAQINSLYEAAKRISVLQNIFEASGGNLDNLAQSYGITRNNGTAATGIVYIDLTQLESRESITVSSGTTITSAGAAAGITFSVVGSRTFSSTSRATFEATAASVRSELDSVGLTDMRLAATVPVVATSAGANGNVGAFTLNSTSITGVNNVINLSPTSGGTNAESDSSLRSRLVALFTGNSVGSEQSLLSAALAPSGILSGFTVLPGDPLMTRDGSEFDDEGNLIEAGTGRAVDIYVLGTSLSTNTEKIPFIQDDPTILSVDNAIPIGQPQTNTFGFLPIFSVSSIVGEESGASFAQGVPVADDEGNILIEGNFALIKDIDAPQYKIVENLITRERKLTTFVSPTSTRYTVVDQFTSSDFANSALSQDRIVFLKNEVAIEDEPVNRGEFNGADQLRFSNVTNIQEVTQDLTINETIRVESFQEVPGGVAITLKHTPVVEIVQVRNTRLGVTYSTEILDAEVGTVLLAGRVPPRTGDFLAIEYVWQQQYKEDLNYSLTGDLINWIGFADERGTTDATLLPQEPVQSQNILASQPNVPSYLRFNITGISDREIVQTDITGQVVDFPENELALKTDESFRFANTGLNSIGRLFKVTNVTKGFDYNLAGYQLQSNRFDPTVSVDSDLLPQQFQLSEEANIDLVEPGDKVVLSRPSRTLALTTESDFENNIGDNVAPVFDPTVLDFTPGGIILKTPLLDTASAVTTLAGLITQDLTLSGIVEVTDDLIISEGVVVDVEPSTTIKVRPSDQLDSQSTFAQRVLFDPTLQQDDTIGIPTLGYEEFVYLFFRPEDFVSSFFTIINDDGQTLSIRFGQDTLVKTVENGEITFYVKGVRVPSSFNSELEATIDLNDITTSIKATLLGARTGVNGEVQFISTRVNAQDKFYVLLERDPVVTSNLLTDFSLAVEADNTLTFERFSYNEDINALEVEGDILAIDGYGDTTSPTNYIVTHFIEESRRLSITVEGVLRVVGATPQTSVLFTSGGGANSESGDWEGIIFTSKSHSTRSITPFQSNLNNARVRFANNGVSIQASDAQVTNCIVRDCRNTGVSVSSTLRSESQFAGANFQLDFAAFNSATRVGFTASDGLQLARYPIPRNMVTSLGELPELGQQLSDTAYEVDLQEGIDYSVFIDLQRAISIDTDVPEDGYADHALVPGTDFVVEYDINTGYSLVFLYTTSPKLRRVHDLLVDLQAKSKPGNITIDLFSSVRNGVVFDNLIFNTSVGLSLSSLATLSINKNTIDNNRTGINAANAIVSIRNNLITGFELAGIISDNNSLIETQRNNIYSNKVTESEQSTIVDTDVLLRAVDPLSITLFTRTPNKFKVGSTIKIDDEEMLVQGVNPDSIIVARGQNNTGFASHQSGDVINLFQLNQIFTVTGIDGDNCQLIETDSIGQQLDQAIPIEMRQIAQNTFRAVFPVNRRADFYYKYRFSTTGSPFTRETETKVFLRNTPGIGINDVVSIFHELPLNSVDFTPNMENFSTDPLYNNVRAADYSYPALASLASSQHPSYGALSAPNDLHRLVGFLEVRIARTIDSGQTRIPILSQPLVVSSLAEEVTITGTDQNNQGVVLVPASFTTSITAEEADLGAIGVLVLDDPVTLSQSGQYQVRYRRPVDLGTSLPPYYIEGIISYVFDIGSQVEFDTLRFNKDDIGGEVQFTLQVADSISALSTAPTSIPVTTGPVLIEEAGNNVGSAIQINIKLLGNDSSYTPELVYEFPTLQDFSFTYTPAKDSREYKVISRMRDEVQDTTNILIDAPISTETFQTVGADPTVEVFVRKKENNFDPADEFLIALAEGVSTGDTFITAQGDLLTRKPDADPNDIIRVDYMSFTGGFESLYFIQGEEQYTRNIYSQIDSITNSITRDSQTVLPSTEQIEVLSANQPEPGSTYDTTYLFEAPLEGERLTIGYTFNDLIRESSRNVESRKSLLADVQIRQVQTVQIRIAVSLEVETDAAPQAVQTQVSNTITQLFSGATDISAERRIDASDIIRATGDIAGIEDIEVTTLSRNLITGEIETIILTRREAPELEAGSPRINTSQNGRSIQIGSN